MPELSAICFFLSHLLHKPLGNAPLRGTALRGSLRPELWGELSSGLPTGPGLRGNPSCGSAGPPELAPRRDGAQPPPLGLYSPAAPGRLSGEAARPPGLPQRRRGRHQGHWQSGPPRRWGPAVAFRGCLKKRVPDWWDPALSAVRRSLIGEIRVAREAKRTLWRRVTLRRGG